MLHTRECDKRKASLYIILSSDLFINLYFNSTLTQGVVLVDFDL